jgi:hypothetical protein
VAIIVTGHRKDVKMLACWKLIFLKIGQEKCPIIKKYRAGGMVSSDRVLPTMHKVHCSHSSTMGEGRSNLEIFGNTLWMRMEKKIC